MKFSALVRRGEFYAVALIAMSIAAFAVVSTRSDGDKMRLALGHLSLWLALGLTGLALINYVLRAVRFQLFARRLGVIVPFRRMLLFYIAGFAMSATPGKLGEFIRVWLIRRLYGYGLARGMPLQIADRVSDVVATVALCFIGLGGYSVYRLPVLAGAALVALGVWVLARPRLQIAVVGLGYRLVGRRRLFGRLRRVVRMTAKLFEPRLFLPALALALLGWSAEGLAFHLTVETVSGAGVLGRDIFIFTFVNLVGAVTFLPGGVGAVELGIVGLLVGAGIALEDAVTVTAIIRLATLWFGILLGVLAMLVVVRISGRVGQDIGAVDLAEPLDLLE